MEHLKWCFAMAPTHRRKLCMPRNLTSRKSLWITPTDILEIFRIPLYVLLARIVPERHWDTVARRAAALHTRVTAPRMRSGDLRRTELFGDRLPSMILSDLGRDTLAQYYLSRLQGFGDRRRRGWHPAIQVNGAEHIATALGEAHGVVLWVTPFLHSNLITKKGLHEVGIQVSHLSRAKHGFSNTRFGAALLNPIWQRIEDRYLAERVRIGPGATSQAALMALRGRLKDNRVVSITVGGQAGQTANVKLFSSALTIAIGPLRLVQAARSVLLPVFTMRTADGSFIVTVEGPLWRNGDARGHDAIETVLGGYVERLEDYILRHPDQANVDEPF